MYFVQKRKPKLQGDKIETPEFIRANNLEIDYEFYITNQIMKPVLQIFALVLEQIPSYRRQIRNFKMKLNTLTQTCEDHETLMKKEIELRNKEVTKLIFGPILTTIKNKKMGVKQLGKYFKTKN
jgi:DNA polymerase elongation subunit (family B)